MADTFIKTKISQLESLFPKVISHHKLLNILLNNFKPELYIKSLRPGQLDALLASQQEDCVATLPTGYGKSLIFRLLPIIMNSSILIASPLDSIIAEQLEKLGDDCLFIDSGLVDFLRKESSDVCCEDDSGSDSEPDSDQETMPKVDDGHRVIVQRFKEGHYRYAVGHPENLTNRHFLKLLSSPGAGQLSHLVVDEAHCILTWGASKFRPAFLALKSLRAFLPECKVLCLTATANLASVKEIGDAMMMRKFALVRHNPDRRNIFMEVLKRPPLSGGDNTSTDSIDFVLGPLLSSLKQEGPNFPKTIVYLPLQWCAYGHDLSARILDIERGPVAQYHAPQTKSEKDDIIKEIAKGDSRIRVMLATEAYGMGTDVPDIRQIIHIGSPTSIETFVQEVGRAGRDGLPASAKLYYNNADIGKNKVHLKDTMRDYCRLTTCRRKFISEYFDYLCLDEDDPVKHSCCDNCRKECSCISCEAIRVDVAMAEELVSGLNLTLSKDTKDILKDMLLRYFQDENKLVTDFVSPESITGLSPRLADKLISKFHEITEAEFLYREFPEVKSAYLNNVFAIIVKVKELFL